MACFIGREADAALLPEPSRSDPEDHERNSKHRTACGRSYGVNHEEESEKEADPNEDLNRCSSTHTACSTPDVLEKLRLKLGFRGVESKSEAVESFNMRRINRLQERPFRA